MSNRYSTAKKIELANAYFNECLTNEGLSLSMRTMEREIEQMNPDKWDLSDFAIPLWEISARHYDLMRTMRWIDFDTGEPLIKDLGTKEPFLYAKKWSNKPGVMEVSYYISVYNYFLLMLIEHELQEKYKAA